MSEEHRPFFSIGVPTYKRELLLKKTIQSCLDQTFGDFEVLIGNDDISTSLTPEMFGNDARVKIINRTKNFGVPGNYNALMYEARGRYFVWLTDDDLYMLGFLSGVHQALMGNKDIRCVYTEFYSGAEPVDVPAKSQVFVQYFSGREFLNLFLDRKYKICCFYAVFEIELIRSMGGLQQVGDSWSPCADMLFPLQAAQAGDIAFINEPLRFFRVHDGSVSSSSTDLKEYNASQAAYWEKALPILLSKNFRADAARNIYRLMKWFLADYFEVIRRCEGKKWVEVFKNWPDMKRLNEYINGHVWGYRFFLVNRCCWLLKHLSLDIFRRQST